ncbi:MAG: hypothetical protein WKG06_37355 [Segetibacter sp.]
MNVAEMKVKVKNKITSINNESVLKEVLALLKEGNERDEASFNLSRNYEAIKGQYWDVEDEIDFSYTFTDLRCIFNL